MNKLLYILPVLALLSCDLKKTSYVRVCTCEDYSNIQSFVQASLSPANNMSDEEMEDVIYELTKTGIRLNCEGRMIDFLYNGWDNSKQLITELDSCETVEFIQ